MQHIAPLLDEALAKLNETDRRAVLLRYFDGQTLGEVGAALSLNEEAARKRVNRGVEKLRKYFLRRGVTQTAAALGVALAANSVQAAPVGLAITVTATVGKGAVVGGSTLTIIKGALKIMAWTKAKMAIAVTAGVFLAAGTATFTIKEIQEHRTDPWQVPNGNSPQGLNALNTTPPQVTIVRSRFTPDTGGGSLRDDIPPKNQWRYIGIHSTPSEMIKRAYWDGDFLLPSQIILPRDMPDGYYDYIANLTNGSQQALQAAIKKKFGLVGKHEARDMDVLMLEVEHPNAPGLKAGKPVPQGQLNRSALVAQGIVHHKNITMSRLCRDLAQELGIPVIDQTGLAGSYDMDIPDIQSLAPTEKLDKIKQILLQEFGLKLVSSRKPVKILIIEKVK